jgi:glyoxalase family protein
MSMQVLGLHHVTAIAGDPQANLDFYTKVLGLRLVKVTVNYDDPHTYHLYYGDAMGRPGTILTFFPWPGAPRGRRGAGQVTTTTLAVPEGALGFWVDRLKSHRIELTEPTRRFGEEVILFRDPDGLQLELINSGGGQQSDLQPRGPVPGSYAIRRFHGVTIMTEGYERSAHLLTETMGAHAVDEQGSRFRYRLGDGDARVFVDLLCVPSATHGRVAVGTVHHVAWRTPDEKTQTAWRTQIAGLGYNVTPILDRSYFRSIYFREPGGVLFEIATDTPGFTVDESVERLGTRLILPDWLEPKRAELISVLPKLRLPQGQEIP